MPKHTPTPNVPPAYQALYGRPSSDLTRDALSLFSQLSERNQKKALLFLKALADDDEETASRMMHEAEASLSRLQRECAGALPDR